MVTSAFSTAASQFEVRRTVGGDPAYFVIGLFLEVSQWMDQDIFTGTLFHQEKIKLKMQKINGSKVNSL